MIKKNTLILLIIMLVLVATFILLQQKGWLDFTEENGPTATPVPAFVNLDINSINEILFTSSNNEDIVISRVDDMSWEINGKTGQISPGNVAEIVSQITSLRTLTVLDIAPEGSATGLDIPTYTFTFSLTDGTVLEINIGTSNPTQTGYYAQVYFNKVVVVPKAGIDRIVEIINASKQLPTPTPKPTSDDIGS